MAKCESPYSAKAQAALEHVKQRKQEKRDEEAKQAKIDKELEEASAKKKERHVPLDQLPKGTVSEGFAEKIKAQYGRVPDGACVKEKMLPQLDVLTETLFFHNHHIKGVYPTLSLAEAFNKQVPANEIPINRFLLDAYLTLVPDLSAGPSLGYMSPEHETELLRHMLPEHVQYKKDSWIKAQPKTNKDAQDLATVTVAQRAIPDPVVIKDGVQGTIVALGGVVFENARVVPHTQLMIKWLVEHLIKALPERPAPDAAMEYCLQFSKHHANAFVVYMRWCTLPDGRGRYGQDPMPCQRMGHDTH